MSQASALDVRELLRLIAEQQASLGKLQQLVVEHVLNESQLDTSTVSCAAAPAASDLVTEIVASNLVSAAEMSDDFALRRVGGVLAQVCREPPLRFPYLACSKQLFCGYRHLISARP